VTPPGYLDINYLRVRVRVHQLSEAGWDSSEIARSLGLKMRQVNRYLALHKPLLMSPRSTQSWVDDAVCRPDQTELFFPSSTGNANRNSKKQAVATCARCPVAEKCFQTAIDNCERVGVWGGRDMADYSYSFDEATGGVKVSVRSAHGSLQNVG
jgi:WhiB family redox-sensing transcriptional regulator